MSQDSSEYSGNTEKSQGAKSWELDGLSISGMDSFLNTAQ